MYTSEVGCLGILHTFRARSCVIVIPVLLTGTQLLMRFALCPLLSWNAEMWMLRTPEFKLCPHGTRIRLGGGRQSISLLIWDRTRQCHQQGSEHTDTRLDFQAKDHDDLLSSLSPGNRLTSNHLWPNAWKSLQGSVRYKFASWKRKKLRFLKKTQNGGGRACEVSGCKLVSGSCPKCKWTGGQSGT